MTAIPARYRAVANRGENVKRFDSTVWAAREWTVEQIEERQRERRRQYERELLERDVSPERRQELLAELREEQRERLRAVERGFDVAGVRGVAVP